MGWICAGMGRFTTPGKSPTAEDAERAEEDLFWGAVFTTAECEPPFLFVNFPFGFSLWSSVPCVVIFFLPALALSALAMASASHGAFILPREALRLLFHSAASSSPLICAMVLPESADSSNSLMS